MADGGSFEEGDVLTSEVLLGAWTHSSGRLVTIEKDGINFVITNGDMISKVPAVQFCGEDGVLHYNGRAGRLWHNVISWSSGSSWTKVTDRQHMLHGAKNRRSSAKPSKAPSVHFQESPREETWIHVCYPRTSFSPKPVEFRLEREVTPGCASWIPKAVEAFGQLMSNEIDHLREWPNKTNAPQAQAMRCWLSAHLQKIIWGFDQSCNQALSSPLIFMQPSQPLCRELRECSSQAQTELHMQRLAAELKLSEGRLTTWLAMAGEYSGPLQETERLLIEDCLASSSSVACATTADAAQESPAAVGWHIEREVRDVQRSANCLAALLRSHAQG